MHPSTSAGSGGDGVIGSRHFPNGCTLLRETATVLSSSRRTKSRRIKRLSLPITPDHCLSRAVGAARVHWMGGIASERHAAEGPGFDRVLVNHRIFQDELGVADHLRGVQPVETPAFIERQKVRQLTRPIPIVLLEGVVLDVGHPIDELVALPIDVINDRVDDHLAGEYRAGAYIGTAVEDWLSPRYPAPSC